MRIKQEILNDLMEHAKRLDPQHYELAAVAMVETGVQIDIRDMFQGIFNRLADISETLLEKD